MFADFEWRNSSLSVRRKADGTDWPLQSCGAHLGLGAGALESFGPHPVSGEHACMVNEI